MNHINNFGGDERSNHRLLSYLKQNVSLDVQKIKHIRKHIFSPTEEWMSVYHERIFRKKKPAVTRCFYFLAKNSSFSVYVFFLFRITKCLF